MNHIDNLTPIRDVRYQFHGKFVRVVQHVLHDGLFLNLDGSHHILQVLLFGVQVTHREVKLLGCQDVELFVLPQQFGGLLSQDLADCDAALNWHVFRFEGFGVQGVGVEVLLNPANQLHIYIFISVYEGLSVVF